MFSSIFKSNNLEISSEVKKDFHVIVIVNNNKIKDLKLDPPFLNRFEKHIVNFKMLLEKREIDINSLKILAKFYHTSIDYIVGLTNQKEPYPEIEKIRN